MIRSAFPLFVLLTGIFSLFRKSKVADPDEAVLTQLRKVGSNLSKLHKIEFFLYFPTRAGAEEAGSRIKQSGFDAEVQRAAQGDSWLCFATKTMIPELADLQTARREFDALVASLGGNYDGWGTGVVE